VPVTRSEQRLPSMHKVTLNLLIDFDRVNERPEAHFERELGDGCALLFSFLILLDAMILFIRRLGGKDCPKEDGRE
jgi:hypothetical protein